jgi:capsular exopolysaccharide synthesis family protein
VASFWSPRQARNDEVDALSEQLVTVFDPAGAASEAYRSLRTTLLYAVANTPPTVTLVTSPGLMDGKSTTCANLAVVLAQAGKETLVIDGDLHRPSLHKIFGVPNVNGMVDVLSGEYDLSEMCTELLPGLKILTAGPLPPNPAELLISGRLASLIDQARRSFDYVLVDSPPTELVSDPMIIATQADAVILVLNSEETSKVSMHRAVRDLEAVGANVVGTIVNKAPKSETSRYDYNY